MWLCSEWRDYPCAFISYIFLMYLALFELSCVAVQWVLGLPTCVHVVYISDVFSYFLALLCSSAQGLDDCATAPWCMMYPELAATPQSIHQFWRVGSLGRVVVCKSSPWWSADWMCFKSVFELCSTVFEGCVRVCTLKPVSCRSHSP